MDDTDSIALEDGMDIPDGFNIDLKKHWARIDKALFPLLDDLGILEKQKQIGLDAFL